MLCPHSGFRPREKTREVLECMKMPPYIDIVRHPYFETNEIGIRIKVNDSKELSNPLNCLREAAENGNIEKLLSIIRDGTS